MNLTSKALLVQLTISQWSARKYDKRVTKAVTNSTGASDDAGRFNKALLPAADKLEAIHKKTTRIRNEYYKQTLPWGMEGTQLLSSRNYMDFMSEFSKMKNEWNALVDSFVASYPTLQADAQRQLGQMYNADDYPSADVIRDKFSIGLNVMPVPSDDFRVEIQDEELEKIREDVTKRVKAAEQAAMKELWQRLYDRVKHIAERLSDPDAKFQASMLENAQELCDILPKLNVSDDADLEHMRMALAATLKGKSPDMLRTVPVVREDTAKKAKEIMNKMDAFMGAR
jgi:hypothetical protein